VFSCQDGDCRKAVTWDAGKARTIEKRMNPIELNVADTIASAVE
jgi:hypothetical protein